MTIARLEPSPSATVGFRLQPETAACVHSSSSSFWEAAAGYFAYSAMAVEGEPIPTEGYVALALGAGFSVIVGVGLMVLLFFSSRRGYDEPPHFR
ncbi:hypothetical protein GA0061098_1003296 [Bradyrhizobium shewense]|uniref:Uncharacterized protein n=1 Tax=Bradyrhizobium shewense TaxID=1761772 RepID=A0A1C3V6L7_9BRAD|nr:hypothetical protein GA0061098_1003296 [Bradyrhizobium shewense]